MYKQKVYSHIDGIIRLNQKSQPKKKILDLINNKFEIKQHPFLPFIKFSIDFNKYDGHKKIKKFKSRTIMLTSHLDSLIYQKYANELSEKYEALLEKDSMLAVNEAAVAYRSGKGDNIDIAKKVIDKIWKDSDVWIIKGDFSDFFDSLNHRYLIKQLRLVLGKEIEDDWWHVIRSLTYHYCFINKYSVQDEQGNKQEGLINIFNREHISLPKLESGDPYFHSLKDFDVFIKKNKGVVQKYSKGIPQGNSMSAILANIYMLSFDEWMVNRIKVFRGMYQRYSDDFVIVIPKENLNEERMNRFKDELVSKSTEELHVKIQPEKTKIYSYNNQRIVKQGETSPTQFDYLGLSFSGHSVTIRPKSIYKFIYKGRNLQRRADRLITIQSIIDENKLTKNSDDQKFFNAINQYYYSYFIQKNFSYLKANKFVHRKSNEIKQYLVLGHNKLNKQAYKKRMANQYYATMAKNVKVKLFSQRSFITYASKIQNKFKDAEYDINMMRQLKKSQNRILRNKK